MVWGGFSPVAFPISVEAVDAQCQHVFGVFDAPPGSGEFEALLRDIAVRAFDFARSDGETFGQGLVVIQLALAAAHTRSRFS